MTARRRRPTLRTAIALALVGSTIAVSVLVTGVVVFTAGRIVYESRQEGLLDEFSTTADALFTSISTASPKDTWKYYAEILPGETVIIDLDSGRSAGELRPGQVPDALGIDDSRRSGDLTSLMTTLDDREVFFVSTVRDDLPQDPSARPRRRHGVLDAAAAGAGARAHRLGRAPQLGASWSSSSCSSVCSAVR